MSEPKKPNTYGSITITPEELEAMLQEAGIAIPPDGSYEVLLPDATAEDRGKAKNALAQLYYNEDFTLKARKPGE